MRIGFMGVACALFSVSSFGSSSLAQTKAASLAKDASQAKDAAGSGASCADLPDHARLAAALAEVTRSGNAGIFTPNMMWATLVNRGGIVCAVAKTGDAWPGSRVISAQKASTATAFSNEKLALSTANLFSAVQPGGSLYGLQHGNPVSTEAAYRGNAAAFGTASDPLVGARIGGVSVFGGGLALYGDKSTVLGGLGVSGDTSCADHIIAWRLRKALGFKAPKGVSATSDDNIVHDISGDRSAGGFGHPVCSPEAKAMAEGLPSEKAEKAEKAK
jgi:uncharacterized protein GlcG (DUF336 family)